MRPIEMVYAVTLLLTAAVIMTLVSVLLEPPDTEI